MGDRGNMRRDVWERVCVRERKRERVGERQRERERERKREFENKYKTDIASDKDVHTIRVEK